jgi:hypothetical protein
MLSEARHAAVVNLDGCQRREALQAPFTRNSKARRISPGHPKAEREMTTSQPASPTVEGLREDQITAAAGVLARAFQNDPPLAYGIPNPAERARMLPMFMKPFVTFASLFGEAYVTAGKLESVAFLASVRLS